MRHRQHAEQPVDPAGPQVGGFAEGLAGRGGVQQPVEGGPADPRPTCQATGAAASAPSTAASSPTGPRHLRSTNHRTSAASTPKASPSTLNQPSAAIGCSGCGSA